MVEARRLSLLVPQIMLDERHLEEFRTPWFVCLFQHAWGRGNTVDEAIKVARSNGGRGSEYFVVMLPLGALNPQVDGMGAIRWDWAEWIPDCLKTSECPEVVNHCKK